MFLNFKGSFNVDDSLRGRRMGVPVTRTKLKIEAVGHPKVNKDRSR